MFYSVNKIKVPITHFFRYMPMTHFLKYVPFYLFAKPLIYFGINYSYFVHIIASGLILDLGLGAWTTAWMDYFLRKASKYKI